MKGIRCCPGCGDCPRALELPIQTIWGLSPISSEISRGVNDTRLAVINLRHILCLETLESKQEIGKFRRRHGYHRV